MANNTEEQLPRVVPTKAVITRNDFTGSNEEFHYPIVVLRDDQIERIVDALMIRLNETGTPRTKP